MEVSDARQAVDAVQCAVEVEGGDAAFASSSWVSSPCIDPVECELGQKTLAQWIHGEVIRPKVLVPEELRSGADVGCVSVRANVK